MTNKPVTLALATAALLTMAGGRANAQAIPIRSPVGLGACPHSITIGQIFAPQLLANTAEVAANRFSNSAPFSTLGIPGDISAGNGVSTYRCLLGNKIFGPFYFESAATGNIPAASRVFFGVQEGAEAISFNGGNHLFPVGESFKAPSYRITIDNPATFPRFTGAASLMFVNPPGFTPGTAFQSTNAPIKVLGDPNVGAEALNLNVQGAIPVGSAQAEDGLAGCRNSSPFYHRVGLIVSGNSFNGTGCGGKFLTGLGSLNLSPLTSNQSLWVIQEARPSGGVEVTALANFWCELPQGCPSTTEPPSGKPPVDPPGGGGGNGGVTVPEPASLSLLLLGLAGLGFESWRSRHGRGRRMRVNEI